MSVNDAYIMRAWGKDQNATGKVTMLADGNGDFTRAIGMMADKSSSGMGFRSKRYLLFVDNGMVKYLKVDKSGLVETSAEAALKNISRF